MEVVNMENIIIKLSMEGLNRRVDTTEEKNTGNLKDRFKHFLEFSSKRQKWKIWKRCYRGMKGRVRGSKTSLTWSQKRREGGGGRNKCLKRSCLRTSQSCLKASILHPGGPTNSRYNKLKEIHTKCSTIKLQNIREKEIFQKASKKTDHLQKDSNWVMVHLPVGIMEARDSDDTVFNKST